jgi:hypothetical protein
LGKDTWVLNIYRLNVGFTFNIQSLSAEIVYASLRRVRIDVAGHAWCHPFSFSTGPIASIYFFALMQKSNKKDQGFRKMAKNYFISL